MTPADDTTVKISPAKGRPMLTWVGKRPLGQVTPFPAQLVESFAPDPGSAHTSGDCWNDWPANYPRSGLLFHGDNKEVLAHLLANGFRGKINLVYIDPPFDSGADYVRKVTLRGATGAARVDGEAYTLGEQIQYTDIWANDNYLQFMYERLLLVSELLAQNGMLYLHCDSTKGHHLRCLLDEVFGPQAFVSEVIWQKIRSSKRQSLGFGNVHDTIYVYARDRNDVRIASLYVPYDEAYIASHYNLAEPRTARKYQLADFTQVGQGEPRAFGDRVLAPPPGKHWIWSQERIDVAWKTGLIVFTTGDKPRVKRYLDESEGNPVEDIWTDVFPINSQAVERGDYPTQKPEGLLERVILASSNPGDLVLDCFAGSGTTAAVSQRQGRRWIACDINKGAVQTTSKRLQTVMLDQIAGWRKNGGQAALPGTGAAGEDVPPAAAQLSLNVYRVNDYDLQIQHNEAVNLACEHIGITRTHNDSFFDGTLGRKLAKIVPFGHAVGPLDLEEIKRELAARPDEDRDVVVVALGKQVAADRWLEDWNRLRTRGDVPNKIEVIELRTDARYGHFFAHQPAQARVNVARTDTGIHVEIADFISPTIMERLKEQAGLLSPQITDWRSTVDTVMIDPAYDGEVFRVALSDVPERKNDLVAGSYDLAAPSGPATVAVKITDMLGEEVLTVQSV